MDRASIALFVTCMILDCGPCCRCLVGAAEPADKTPRFTAERARFVLPSRFAQLRLELLSGVLNE